MVNKYYQKKPKQNKASKRSMTKISNSFRRSKRKKAQDR